MSQQPQLRCISSCTLSTMFHPHQCLDYGMHHTMGRGRAGHEEMEQYPDYRGHFGWWVRTSAVATQLHCHLVTCDERSRPFLVKLQYDVPAPAMVPQLWRYKATKSTSECCAEALSASATELRFRHCRNIVEESSTHCCGHSGLQRDEFVWLTTTTLRHTTSISGACDPRKVLSWHAVNA